MSIVIHTDGGSRSNPGPAGIGVHATQNKTVIFTLSEFLGTQTNNYAEYTAVIRALETCIEKKLTSETIDFFMDSKLVVEQVQGNWKVKEPTLRPLVARVQELAARFPVVSFTHVRREYNKEADALANEAMDTAA
jgi:probable phosphoglycerate mutase